MDNLKAKGRVYDHITKQGLRNTAVTDGVKVSLTDAQGYFELDLVANPVSLNTSNATQYIWITVPAGYRPLAGQSFYQNLSHQNVTTATEDGVLEFALAKYDASAQSAFSFTHITDLHLTTTQAEANSLQFDAEWQIVADRTIYQKDNITYDELKQDLLQIASGKPSFIVATGDLTEFGTTTQLVLYRDLVEEITASTGVPIFSLPGNHDYIDDEARGLVGTNWLAELGPAYYSFDWGNVHFVVLDCEGLRLLGRDYTQNHWLLADLAVQPKNKPIIFLTHWVLDDAFYRPLVQAGYHILASLSGHWHSSRRYLSAENNIIHYTTPALSFGGIDYSPRGYRLLHYNKDSKLTTESRSIRQNSARIIQDFEANEIKIEWQVELPGRGNIGGPVADKTGERVFFSLMSEDEESSGKLSGVAALHTSNGEIDWVASLPASVKNSPSYGDGLVFALTVTGLLSAFDSTTGQKAWEQQLGDPSRRWCYSSPFYQDGKVFAGSSGYFASFEAKTGQKLWKREDLGERDYISSYPGPVIVGDNQLLVSFTWAFESPIIINATTGETIWQQHGREVESPVSTTTINNHKTRLYLHRNIGTLQAFELASKSVMWEQSLGYAWNNSRPILSADEEMVYSLSGLGWLRAYTTQAGYLQWEIPLLSSNKMANTLTERVTISKTSTAPYVRNAGAVTATPVLLGQNLLVALPDGNLAIVDAQEGSLSNVINLEGCLSSNILMVADLTILYNREGMAYGLDCTKLKK